MSKKIWIVVETRGDALHRMAREAVNAGQQLAAAVGGHASAVLLGSRAEGARRELEGLDLEAVLVAEDAALASYTPGGYVGALAPAILAHKPDYVVFPHTYQTVEYMPRLGQAVEAAIVSEAIAFESSAEGVLFLRPILGGKLQARVRVRGEGTVFVSIQSGAFSAEVRTGSASPQAIDGSAAAPDREILGVEDVTGEQVDLSAAEVIVAAGRGVGSAENMAIVEALAKAMGAEIGASRPVIDSGWLPRDRQIGSSGQTVAPKLYLAIGVSGAIQHLVGMKGSGVVVAINKDPGAPIFGLCDYGIVGDLNEIVPALTEAIQAAKTA